MFQKDVLTCPCCRQTGKPDASQALQGMGCQREGTMKTSILPGWRAVLQGASQLLRQQALPILVRLSCL